MNGPLCSAISGCNKTAHGKKPEENITIKDVYSFFKFSVPPTFIMAKESYWWLFLILTRTLLFFLTFLPLFNTDINWVFSCLVPVRRFPNSFRWRIRSEGAGNASHFRMDHVTRNALAARKNEAKGLGKVFLRTFLSRQYLHELLFLKLPSSTLLLNSFEKDDWT